MKKLGFLLQPPQWIRNPLIFWWSQARNSGELDGANNDGQGTQGLIETQKSMVIFDENQVVSDLNKYDFPYPMKVKIIKFLVILHHFNNFNVKRANVPFMGKYANYVQMCYLWANVLLLDEYAIYGQMCYIWTNVPILDKCATFG